MFFWHLEDGPRWDWTNSSLDDASCPDLPEKEPAEAGQQHHLQELIGQPDPKYVYFPSCST
jgi:hypothetical protein